MADTELGRIGEIDRSEHVTHEYSYRHGVLKIRNVDISMPQWSQFGHRDDSVEGNIDAWQSILAQGGTLIGAFDIDDFDDSGTDLLVGCAIYRPDFAESMANFAVLYVSRSHRRKRVGSLLADEVARLARADGARRLYVSATPSGPTVEFYRAHGFAPTNEPNEALFALEPLDIHMIREL